MGVKSTAMGRDIAMLYQIRFRLYLFRFSGLRRDTISNSFHASMRPASPLKNFTENLRHVAWRCTCCSDSK